MTPAEEVRAAATKLRTTDPLYAGLLDQIATDMDDGEATVRNTIRADGGTEMRVHPCHRPLGERKDWTKALAAARQINATHDHVLGDPR